MGTPSIRKVESADVFNARFWIECLFFFYINYLYNNCCFFKILLLLLFLQILFA